MQSLRQWISRIRSSRLWRSLRHMPRVPTLPLPMALSLEVTSSRPILRDVTPHGVRVYSLCGSCGAHLAASATLCDACARSRSAPNS
jgi:hypothetical protein